MIVALKGRWFCDVVWSIVEGMRSIRQLVGLQDEMIDRISSVEKCVREREEGFCTHQSGRMKKKKVVRLRSKEKMLFSLQASCVEAFRISLYKIISKNINWRQWYNMRSILSCDFLHWFSPCLTHLSTSDS